MHPGLLSLSVPEITAWLGQWWWPFIRISAALWMLPVFGDSRVTTPVRMLFAAMLSLLVAPLLSGMPAVDPFALSAILLALEQIVFGLLFGLFVQFFFLILTMAGHILSMQMGLAMAIMNDPINGDTAPIIGQMMLIFCTLLFLALNGHLVTLELLVASFRQWPVGSSLYHLDLDSVVNLLGWSISSALALTMPAVVAMLLVNLTFGVMNRVAPSLNIISLGFPMTLLLGLVAMLLSVDGVSTRYLELVQQMFASMQGMMAP